MDKIEWFGGIRDINRQFELIDREEEVREEIL